MKGEIELIIAGEDPAPEAWVMATELGTELGVPIEVRRAPVVPAYLRRGDPLAVAALVVSIPAAVFAVVDLAERARRLEVVQRALGRATRVALPGAPEKNSSAVTADELEGVAAPAVTGPDPAPAIVHDFMVLYASPDAPFALPLAGALRRCGSVFIDRESVAPGADWRSTISGALEVSRTFVVLVSRASRQSWYQGDEISRAVSLVRRRPDRHRVVPVYLEGLPDDPSTIPYGLATIQGIDGKKLGHEGAARVLCGSFAPED